MSRTVVINDETPAQLIEEVRKLFGRAIEKNGRLADAADAVDDLCDAVVERVTATFAALVKTEA